MKDIIYTSIGDYTMDSDIPTFGGNLIMLLIISLRRTIFSSTFKTDFFITEIIDFFRFILTALTPFF